MQPGQPQSDQAISLAAKGMIHLFRWAHVAIVTALVFGLAYFLGHGMLSGSLRGNDSAMHVAYATWANRYLPNLPHWYPLQGGGESIVHGYPLLSHVLVALVSRVGHLSILQSFRLVSFLSFPLAAMGIYAFSWKAFKNQTIGLIAAIFFLLAPITWTWTHDWGFFAQGVGIVFMLPALVCFDGFLSAARRGPGSGRRRLWQAGMICALILASLSHPLTGAGAVLGMTLHVLFASLLAEPGTRQRALSHGTKGIITSGVLVTMILAFYLVPFYQYGLVANREGLNVLPLAGLPRLPYLQFFGLHPSDPAIILTRAANPLASTVFLILGALLLACRSRKGLAWVLVAIVAAVYSLIPEFQYAISSTLPIVSLVLSFRSTMVLAMVMFPVATGIGAWILAELAISAVRGAWRPDSVGVPVMRFGIDLPGLASSFLAVVLALVAAFRLGSVTSGEPFLLSYGPNTPGVDLRDIWNRRASDACLTTHQSPLISGLCALPAARAQLNIQEFAQECDHIRDQGQAAPPLCQSFSSSRADVESFLSDCRRTPTAVSSTADPCRAVADSRLGQLLEREWPTFLLSDEDPSIARSQALAGQLPKRPMLRIDVSPLEGRLAQDIASHADASQIEAYTQQVSLIHLMWGYQLGVFYSDEYGSPSALNDLADWMGISYVYIDPEGDPVEKYQAAGWSRIYADADVELWANAAAPPMATARTKPALLVIADPESGSFPLLFRLANEGLAPYSEYSIVEGAQSVEDYSPDDLRQFDIIFMNGYRYRNPEKAWGLLEGYVREGGSLFVDTGWQYTVPEWEFERAPAVLPVTRLSWTNYGKETNYTLDAARFGENVDLDGFGPLIWEDAPWGVSGANPEDLRDWARPVLSVGDNPLILAGQYGLGRVSWSGMNLLSHMIAYDSPEEAQLLHNLLNWLAEGKGGTELPAPAVARDHPDQVLFSVSTQAGDINWLYWREAYYASWHAYVTDSAGAREIPIYRGGPGFMLMPIETTDPQVTVTLRWELPLVEKAAIGASALGLLLLVALVVDGLFLGGNGFTWLKIGLVMRIPRPFLGEGSNREWAEQKRAELEAGQFSPDTPPHLIPSQAIAWWKGEQHARQGSPHAGSQYAATAPTPDGGSHNALPATRPDTGSDGQQMDPDPSIESPTDDVERDLLESWLTGTGHDDDAWAVKLLARRNPENGA